MEGSSPHAWGPRHLRRRRRLHRGIIPTRVGTTSRSRCAAARSRDHPHTRGDHTMLASSVYAMPGSSPHAWGPPFWGVLPAPVLRIIPTRVGTTFAGEQMPEVSGDHPHTRGDHRSPSSSFRRRGGSSPHAWGPLQDVVLEALRLGIIPTRVGTTGAHPARWRRPADHPHTRGDHASWVEYTASTTGSSPHAWGPRRAKSLGSVRGGIIPTRVGTTRRSRPSGRRSRNHPHTRGDHSVVRHVRQSVAGSSPHAWGPQDGRCGLLYRGGIIPTRVGTTARCDTWRFRVRDHPHTRGDHHQ